MCELGCRYTCRAGGLKRMQSVFKRATMTKLHTCDACADIHDSLSILFIASIRLTIHNFKWAEQTHWNRWKINHVCRITEIIWYYIYKYEYELLLWKQISYLELAPARGHKCYTSPPPLYLWSRTKWLYHKLINVSGSASSCNNICIHLYYATVYMWLLAQSTPACMYDTHWRLEQTIQPLMSDEYWRLVQSTQTSGWGSVTTRLPAHRLLSDFHVSPFRAIVINCSQ